MNPNKKLESLFDLAPIPERESDIAPNDSVNEETTVRRSLTTANKTLERIQAAMPAVRELEQVDSELDSIAERAMESFADLSDLGMQVDSRFAAEIFSVASSMMGHAITAKTAKANRKLKTLDLQMKQFRLEMDAAKKADTPAAPLAGPVEVAEGQILSRNELMNMLQGGRGAAADNEES